MNVSNREIYNRIHRLVTTQLRGKASEEDLATLREIATGDASDRRAYLHYMEELFHLSSRLTPLADDGMPNAAEAAASTDTVRHADGKQTLAVRSSASRAAGGRGTLFFAAAALLLLATALFFTASDDASKQVRETATSVGSMPAVDEDADGGEIKVATLVHRSGVVSDGNNDNLPELTRLVSGQTLCLQDGSAEIVFDSGVEAIALAPCMLMLDSAEQMSVEYGRITARVGEQGRGFKIETAVARVTDIGTAFGVEVAESGETSVAVFEGEVDLEYGKSDELLGKLSSKRNRLTQGEGLKINRFGVSSRLFSIDSETLPQVRQLPPISHGKPVVSAVVDNIDEAKYATRNYYRIVRSGFREDCQAFVDRVHQWNGIDDSGIPQELVGADYIMPFNDDKFVPNLEVKLFLSMPATVYVFLSNDEVVPDWIARNFTSTGLVIGLDEGLNRFREDLAIEVGAGNSIDTVFSIWKREIESPLNVTLGPVRKPAKRVMRNGKKILPGYNMYGIAAVAL